MTSPRERTLCDSVLKIISVVTLQEPNLISAIRNFITGAFRCTENSTPGSVAATCALMKSRSALAEMASGVVDHAGRALALTDAAVARLIALSAGGLVSLRLHNMPSVTSAGLAGRARSWHRSSSSALRPMSAGGSSRTWRRAPSEPCGSDLAACLCVGKVLLCLRTELYMYTSAHNRVFPGPGPPSPVVRLKTSTSTSPVPHSLGLCLGVRGHCGRRESV